MSTLYFDSSALVKYYLIEPGTPWVRSIMDQQTDQGWEHEISTSILSVAEVVSAFAKRRRAKEISPTLYDAVISRFLREGRQRCQLFSAHEVVIDLATELLQRYPLRAYDAVQLATALELNQILRGNRLPLLTFISADKALCDAAGAAGLRAEDPNDHP